MLVGGGILGAGIRYMYIYGIFHNSVINNILYMQEKIELEKYIAIYMRINSLILM